MWMCLNMSEFTITDMILNIYQTILIARSLYKLISTYWEISGISLGIYIYKHIQNPVKNLRWSALEKQLEFSTIFAKKLHFKSLRRFCICVGFQICQSSGTFVNFRKYDRVLNMHQDAIWKGSKHSRILGIPGFCICKCCATFWICLKMAE